MFSVWQANFPAAENGTGIRALPKVRRRTPRSGAGHRAESEMKVASAVKCALYCRVSTRDKDQDVNTQLLPLRRHASGSGWEIAREYSDEASALDLRGRVAWRQLLKDAALRKFSCVLVLRLDRAFRSVSDLHATLQAWESQEVELVSLREGFDTKSAAGRLLMNFLASFAEFELALIRERILDGLSRARAEGKHLGRPLGKKDGGPRKKGGYRLRWALQAKARGE